MHYIRRREVPYKMLANELARGDAAMRAGGFRIECRAVSEGADDLAACANKADASFGYAQQLMNEGILKVRRVPIPVFLASVAESLRQCNDKGVWSGFRNEAPVEGGPVRNQAFEVKRLHFCLLQAQLGIATGRSVQTVIAWIRSQRPDPRVGDWLRGSAMRHPQPTAATEPVPAAPTHPTDAMAPLPVTRRHRASQLLGKLPRSPKQPSDVGAGPPTAQDPNQLPALANYANDEEALIGELVGQRVLKGAGYYFFYKPPWGTPGGRRPKSKGYKTMAAMVHAIVTWAGDEWSARVTFSLDNVPDAQ
jgi:hypothetical protein